MLKRNKLAYQNENAKLKELQTVITLIFEICCKNTNKLGRIRDLKGSHISCQEC